MTYDLRKDETFRQLMIDKRARLLAEVDDIEKFLEWERTKDLRKAAKDERRPANENYAGVV